VKMNSLSFKFITGKFRIHNQQLMVLILTHQNKVTTNI
jgi:hypothetical protein